MDYGIGARSRAVVTTGASQSGLWNRCRKQSCGEHWSQTKVDYATGVESRAVVRTGASKQWTMEQVQRAELW